MKVRDLRYLIQHLDDEMPVIIYNDGDFVVEDAWHDKSRAACRRHVCGVFAIQVIPEPEGDADTDPGQKSEEQRGSAQRRLEQDMKDSGRW